MALLDRQPSESEPDWRKRTTPPTDAQGDDIPYDEWQTQLVPQASEPYDHWKERVQQKHKEEQGMLGARKFDPRVKRMLPLHPEHSTQAASGKGPGGGSGRGGQAQPTAAPLVLEDVPNFSGGECQSQGTVNIGYSGSFPPNQTAAKKRIKLFFYFFSVAGVDDDLVKINIRRRTFKWVRRNYAQANLAPKIVDIQRLDWPAKDTMLSFNAYHKLISLPGSGIKDPSAGPCTLELTIEKASAQREGLTIQFEGGQTLEEMANSTRRELEHRGYTVDMRELPPFDHGFQSSWDLLIQHTGAPVSIRSATLTVQSNRDSQLPRAIQVPRMTKSGRGEPEQVDGDDMQIGGSPMQRRILYSGAHQAGCVNIFVVPAMEIHGRAFPAYTVLRSAIRPRAELGDAAIMAYKSGGASAMNETDQYPFVLSHEIDHVLAETGHNEAEGDLMRGKADPQEKVIKANSVAGSKRIYSAPLLVGSDDLSQVDSDVPIPHANQDMAADMFSKGARFLDGW